jgi:hypothetical protein
MKIFLLWIMIFISSVTGYANAAEPREIVKIDYLISAIAELKGAKFIRNSKEYDTKAATEHLRLKLRAAGDRVKTADDFIELCASRSSVSGKPYRIRFSDGTEMEAGVFFSSRLKALNGKAQP